MNNLRYIILLNISFIFYALCCMEKEQPLVSTRQEEPAWRQKFEQFNHANTKQKLGFNPQVELRIDNNPNVIHKCITVYFHGWLSAKNAHPVIKRYENSKHIPGDKVIFNFEDASTWVELPQWLNNVTGIRSVPLLPPAVWKSNFAQEKDIITGIVVLNALYESDIKEFVLYGQSRGGAVVNNILPFLYHASCNEVSEECIKLLKIKINQERCKDLIDAIKLVHKDVPLKDVGTALQIHPFIPSHLAPFFAKVILPLFTCYNPDYHQPITYLESVSDKEKAHKPGILHFQYNDSKVSNIDDVPFAQLCLQCNQNLCVTLGETGGHEDGYLTIRNYIHVINKKYGGSYINDCSLTDENTILNNEQTDETVKEFIIQHYTEFKNNILISPILFLTLIKRVLTIALPICCVAYYYMNSTKV